MVIKKARSFCDEVKITDKCTFSSGWLWFPEQPKYSSNKKLPVRTYDRIGSVR